MNEQRNEISFVNGFISRGSTLSANEDWIGEDGLGWFAFFGLWVSGAAGPRQQAKKADEQPSKHINLLSFSFGD